jgi:hypothetical protein
VSQLPEAGEKGLRRAAPRPGALKIGGRREAEHADAGDPTGGLGEETSRAAASTPLVNPLTNARRFTSRRRSPLDGRKHSEYTQRGRAILYSGPDPTRASAQKEVSLVAKGRSMQKEKKKPKKNKK